jgi:hypothetical protein
MSPPSGGIDAITDVPLRKMNITAILAIHHRTLVRLWRAES